MKNRRMTMLPIAITALALVVFQLAAVATGRSFYLTQMTMTAYYAIVVMGLCLVMGYAGQISLAQGAFFAMGGYGSAFLTTHDWPWAHTSAWGQRLAAWGLLWPRKDIYGDAIVTCTPWTAFVMAMVMAALVAWIIGWPALRLKGHYLAMATLGFGLIVYRVLLGTQVLGAADGITAVPPWPLGGGLVLSGQKSVRVMNYYLAWGLALLVLLLLLNLVKSRVGRALRSIHGGEVAANAMGVNTAALKLQAFVLSAALAAAAGSCLTHFNGGIGPSEANAMKSVRYVALVAAGGMANLWGVLTISSILTFLSLRGCFGTLDDAVFGTMLIVIVSLAPEGPIQPIRLALVRFARRGHPATVDATDALPEENETRHDTA